ncbi:MAG TPA: 2Fe-2S iron-sulfur cluster-binding protein, partial [Hyphomonadaceae bacterium]|nr:2Fe-2S iron-sulfur cluster-binding protein [Hyphomonadaceae bacterium]
MTEARTIRFKLNGAPVSVSVMPHETLVDILTHKLDLKGARESCGQGLCGCCTVYVDGQSVSSCLYLGQFVEGKNVSTIEGLREASEL